MIAAIALVFFIYFHLYHIFLFPSKLNPIATALGFSIQVPKIQAQATVIENVDPWNEAEYDKALEHGVAQAKRIALPGQPGMIFLFAHSSQEPWKITRENVPFLRLGELQNNDVIYLYRNGKKYTYQVTNKKEVWPNEVSSVLQPN